MSASIQRLRLDTMETTTLAVVNVPDVHVSLALSSGGDRLLWMIRFVFLSRPVASLETMFTDGSGRRLLAKGKQPDLIFCLTTFKQTIFLESTGGVSKSSEVSGEFLSLFYKPSYNLSVLASDVTVVDRSQQPNCNSRHLKQFN